jgi:hypothetical protein
MKYSEFDKPRRGDNSFFQSSLNNSLNSYKNITFAKGVLCSVEVGKSKESSKKECARQQKN